MRGNSATAQGQTKSSAPSPSRPVRGKKHGTAKPVVPAAKPKPTTPPGQASKVPKSPKPEPQPGPAARPDSQGKNK